MTDSPKSMSNSGQTPAGDPASVSEPSNVRPASDPTPRHAPKNQGVNDPADVNEPDNTPPPSDPTPDSPPDTQEAS